MHWHARRPRTPRAPARTLSHSTRISDAIARAHHEHTSNRIRSQIRPRACIQYCRPPATNAPPHHHHPSAVGATALAPPLASCAAARARRRELGSCFAPGLLRTSDVPSESSLTGCLMGRTVTEGPRDAGRREASRDGARNLTEGGMEGGYVREGDCEGARVQKRVAIKYEHGEWWPREG